MDTSKLAALVAAADAGSLSGAAKRLRRELSTVSRQVSDLESSLAAPLLIRTGRGVRPTPAGERYVERARSILQELDAAAAEARGEPGVVTDLRLSVPVEIALQVMPGVVAELLRLHPSLHVDVRSEVRRVSLLEEEYDAAIRVGPLKSSDLLSRKLGAVSLVLCGTPEAARRTVSLAALRAAEMVLVAGTRTEMQGSLRGRKVRLETKGRCRVNTFTEAASLAAASTALVVLPGFTAAPWLRSQRLVRVLPDLALPRVDLHAVYRPHHRGSPVLRDLGALLTTELERAEEALLPL